MSIFSYFLATQCLVLCSVNPSWVYLLGVDYIGLMFFGYLCDAGYIYPRSIEFIKLTCRTLSKTNTNDKFTQNRSNNRFAKEFDLLFMYIADILDFAACKYISPEVLPVLVQQEKNHALMHKDQKQKPIRRFDLVRSALDFALLRCGPWVGGQLLCSFETSGAAFFSAYIFQPFILNILCDASLYHILEEAEHGCITVAYLRPKSTWWVRAILAPVMTVLVGVLFMVPLVTHIAMQPWDLLSPRTYWDAFMYCVVVFYTTLTAGFELCFHFAAPNTFQGETVVSRDEQLLKMKQVTSHIPMTLGISTQYAVMM